MNQVIKNSKGIPVAKIIPVSGKLMIELNNGKKLGFYDPKTNITTTYHGKKVGTGNLLTSLIPPGVL